MDRFFQEEFNIYRKLLNRESHKSTAGLEILNNCVTKIQECVENSTNVHEIQRNIRLVSSFSHILETFNTNVERLLSSIDAHTFNDAMINSPNANCLRITDWFADLSTYKVGNTFSGFVSYILDGDKKLCFIKDLGRHAIVDFKEYIDSVVQGIPNHGYIFALELNKQIFRAIRIDSEITNMSFRVRLIDVGQTVSLSPNVLKFNLVIDAQRIPPMAILCCVDKLNGKTMTSADSINKKMFDVKINNICVNMLEVDLSTETESHEEEMNTSLEKSIIECAENANHEHGHENGHEYGHQSLSMAPQTTRRCSATPQLNPFIDEIPSADNQRVQTPIMSGTSVQPSPAEHVVAASNLAPPRPQLPLPPIPPRQQRPKSIEPMRIPVNIVRGEKQRTLEINNSNHVEVDDKQLDSPEGASVPHKNGAHPKQQQLKIRPENGHPQGHSTPEMLPMPSKNDEIAVIVSHVSCADQVYVQFADWMKRFETFQSTLQKLQPKHLSYISKQKDLVLSRYSGDGCIYRARVESIYQKTITVFYVDYGNFETVDCDSLFEWDPLCNNFPFQAVFCRLNNIHCLPETSANAIFEFVYNNYLTKMCKIRVLDYAENELSVEMKNANGRDIVEEIKMSLFPECIV